MRSSRRIRLLLCACALVLAWAPRAFAQSCPSQGFQCPQGFASERLYTSAPGGGWIVMDDLDMHGGLGGAIALGGGYAHRPLVVASADGSERPQRVAVVSDQASVSIGLAATYDRYRLYLGFVNPVYLAGESGAVGPYFFTAPQVDPGRAPDLLSDTRIGFDVRLLGDPGGPFRLGAGAQVWVANGNRDDYDSDATFRGMVRGLFAGNVGVFSYAGHVGVHIRPLDDSPAPGSPRGSELLYGVAAGPRIPIGASRAVVVGPEIFGATAFNAFSSSGTALEGLLSGRLEGTGERGPQLRLKLGAGAGLDAHFGAPEWRVVFGVEVFNHRASK
jgi:hypothetical protein